MRDKWKPTLRDRQQRYDVARCARVYVRACACVRVCVCEREKEGEREAGETEREGADLHVTDAILHFLVHFPFISFKR